MEAIEIMSKNYYKISPIGQFDQYSCWAASLSWWLKAVGSNRPQLSQQQLIANFDADCDSDGGMPTKTFANKVCGDARFRLNVRFVAAADLAYYTIQEPTIIIYNYPEVGGTHMNVIFQEGYDSNADGITVGCMEPYYPIDAANGQRRGKIMRRSLIHFMNSEEIGLASARS